MKRLLKDPNFLMIIYSILVAGSFNVGHLITNYMDTSLLIFTRFLIASIIFGIYVNHKYGLTKPSLKDLVRYFTISSCLVIYFWGMFEALKYTSALNTGIIYTLVPMFSTLFGYFILKEKPSLKKIIILCFAMMGAVWVISDGSFKNLIHLEFGKGEIIFIIACISMGLFSPFSKWLSRDEETPVMTFWTLATGTILLLFVANIKIVEYQWSEFPIQLAIGMVYLVFCTTIATFFIIQYSSKKMPVSKVMSYIYIIPVFVVIIQILMGKGIPNIIVIPGILTAGICTFLFQKA